MRKIYTDEYHAQRNIYTGPSRRGPKQYGFFSFLFDVIMFIVTSGFWIIWIFVREMRRHRRAY